MPSFKNIQKRSIKFILPCIAIGLVLAIILSWGGLNIVKFFIYSDYYTIKTDLCRNPGLSDGFVCQGIAAHEDSANGDRILVSGYMKDGGASRVYVTDIENNSYYVKLSLADGSAYTGHAGGVAIHGSTVYIADDHTLITYSLGEILSAKSDDTVSAKRVIPVNNAASFVYASSTYLYVGEFHDGKNYITENPYTTAEGENHAIVSLYTYEELESDKENPVPDRIYSIRDKVQGICFTPDGKVVMATSYGLADSIYYIYNRYDAFTIAFTEDDVPVYGFASKPKAIKGPAMAEGLDYYNGKVITLTESASDKYIFGKFFFADKIVSLDI